MKKPKKQSTSSIMKAMIYTSSKQQSCFFEQPLCDINHASDELHCENTALNYCRRWRSYRFFIKCFNKLPQKLRAILRNEGVA